MSKNGKGDSGARSGPHAGRTRDRSGSQLGGGSGQLYVIPARLEVEPISSWWNVHWSWYVSIRRGSVWPWTS